jgi:simple sugar transport system ATP-binding protein
MVFQHFSLFDALSVAENVALGMENPPPMRDLSARIAQVSRDYGLPLDPGRTVRELSAGERQRVEITRCLLQDPKLLIMDEPTSVLTPQEVAVLFGTLRKLREEGTAILTSRTSSRRYARSARRRRSFAAGRWWGRSTRRGPRPSGWRS